MRLSVRVRRPLWAAAVVVVAAVRGRGGVGRPAAVQRRRGERGGRGARRPRPGRAQHPARARHPSRRRLRPADRASRAAVPAPPRARGRRHRRPSDPEALGLDPFSAARCAAAARPAPRVLQRIAECESGGNPRAVSPDGTYRGKYQFSRETWRALGGAGDPGRRAGGAAGPDGAQAVPRSAAPRPGRAAPELGSGRRRRARRSQRRERHQRARAQATPSSA